MLVAPLSGCLECTNQLDVRQCLPDQPTCGLADGALAKVWDDSHAASWPDVDKLLREVPAGKHLHADWTDDRTAAFWQGWGIDPRQPDKELYVHVEGEAALFRIRVLEC